MGGTSLDDTKTTPDPENAETLKLDDTFPFVCHSGRSCFNRCCHDVNIYLSPYDILRLRSRLGMHSGEFLGRHTVPLFLPAVGHPVAVLKLEGEERRCPFADAKGCVVYDDRPWSCRSFPQDPVERTPPSFRVVRRSFCEGFDEPFGDVPRTVSEWRADQGVGRYERCNARWAAVTHHPRFAERNLLSGQARDIFFLGSFNLDEFRAVVDSSGFRNHFLISSSRLDAVRRDDEALLDLAVDWMLTTLFGENILPRGKGSR